MSYLLSPGRSSDAAVWLDFRYVTSLLLNSDSLMRLPSVLPATSEQATLHNEQDGLVLVVVVVVAVTNAASICCNGSKVLYDFLL